MIKPFFVVLITLFGLSNTNAQTEDETSSEILNYCIANIESTNERLFSEICYYERNIIDFPKPYKDKIHATLKEVDKFYEETGRIQKYTALEDSIIFNNDPYLKKVEILMNFLTEKNINDQITQPLITISKRFEKR